MTESQPLTPAERYLFDVYGYVVRRSALSSDEVAALNAAVDRLAVAPPSSSIESQRFAGFLRHDEAFRRLLDHDAVLAALVEMCGPTVRVDHVYGIVMAPGTGGLGLHGGGTPHDPAQFYEVRDGRMRNGLVAVQWALVDHQRGHGGFTCVPGSHRANFALPADAGPSLAVDVPLAAGDVVLFTEGLTHGTLPWQAPYQRRSLLFKYAPGHAAWGVNYQQEFDELRRSSLLTARQARLMQPPAVYPHDPI